MTKKLPLHVKLQRKPISRACVFCHQKHLQCDSTRPCKNCIKRNVADSCQDVQRKRTSKTRTRSSRSGRRPENGGSSRTRRVRMREEEIVEEENNNQNNTDISNDDNSLDSFRPLLGIVDGSEKIDESANNKSSINFEVITDEITQNNFLLPSNAPQSTTSNTTTHPTEMSTIDLLNSSNSLEAPSLSSEVRNANGVQSAENNLDSTSNNNGTDANSNIGVINNFDTDFNFFDTGMGNLGLTGSTSNVDLSKVFYDGLNNQMMIRPFIKLGNDDDNNNTDKLGTTPSEDFQINSNQRHQSMTPSSSITNYNNHPQQYHGNFDSHFFPEVQNLEKLQNDDDQLTLKISNKRNHSTQDFINDFKRNNNYKSPLTIRKKVFQEVGDLYSKFPIFDLDKLYEEEITQKNSKKCLNSYNDLKYIIGILSFSYMKSYQELIKYFYDRLYLQNTNDNFNYNELNNEENYKSKILRKKLFFKILEKIWVIHNHFRIQSALIQTDQTNLTNFSDNLLTELMFQRQLINFENMINNLTSTPAIIWRRSTEIVFLSDDICKLIGIKNKSKFLSSKRRFLCEVIDDMSILNYFKLFNLITMGDSKAFHHNVHNRFDNLKNRFSADIVDDLENELGDEYINNGSKIINGGLIRFNCKFINYGFNESSSTMENFQNFENNLVNNDEFGELTEQVEKHQRFINCSSILTIKKDMFDIPMLITGQFLPILNN